MNHVAKQLIFDMYKDHKHICMRMFCMLKIIKIVNVWNFKIMYENKSAICTVNYNLWLLLCRNWGLENKAAVHNVVFCVVTLCSRVGEYKRFKEIYCPLLHGRNEPSVATVRCWAKIHKTLNWRICYTEEIKSGIIELDLLKVNNIKGKL